MKKTCFVIMGFGKKMDYRNSKEVDLDIIFQDVIKKLFDIELKEYELIRADEVSGSAIIDVSMYALLMKADLVIADITTLNENAIYELGVRHALKPFSTIIMMQESEGVKIPFDLNHCRIFTYNDYGEKLDEQEAEKIRERLKRFVKASEQSQIDSPFYTYLPNVQPPTFDDAEYQEIMQSVKEKEDNIAKYRKKAEMLKKECKFEEAIMVWEKLFELLPNNEYVLQQLAFAHYKSKQPNEAMALQNALQIISNLKPEKSLDLETIGIAGAIYKRLFKLHQNYDYLDKAIEMYHKGYMIKDDYYNGENYANCLLYKTQKKELCEEELVYLKFESKRTYRVIAEKIERILLKEESDYWMYATLSTSYFVLENAEKHEKYRLLFEESANSKWEIASYQEELEDIKGCLN